MPQDSGTALNACASYAFQPLYPVQNKDTNKLLGSNFCAFGIFLTSWCFIECWAAILGRKAAQFLFGV